MLERENTVFRLLVGLTSAICAAMLAAFAVPTFAAPAQSACSIMTKDEVKQFSTNPEFDQIPAQEEKVTQGSGCTFPGIYVQLDPFPVATFENMKRQPGMTLEAAPGIGDAAFLRDNRGTFAELAGRVGPRVFTIQMTIRQGETYASVKPRLLRIGTAMAAKLR